MADPVLPMDLEMHMRTAISARLGSRFSNTQDSISTLAGIAEGIANWMLQREESFIKNLSEWPSELLERTSVMLAMAAIEAAKREAATPHEVLRNREGKCARKVCEYEHDGLKHKVTGYLYCAHCRRQINNACNEVVVLSINQQNALESK